MKKLTFLLFAISTHLLNAQTTNPAPYCDASFDDAQGFWVDDHINSVSFGTLNNVTNSQYAAPHYVFYNNLPVSNFNKGGTYTLSVNFTTAGGCGYGVWIDFNRNNVFEASEKVMGTTGTTTLPVGTTTTQTQQITIPATASAGNTRMRVRIVEDDEYNMVTTNEQPCNLSASPTDVMDWGETEDYTINITSTTGVDNLNQTADFHVYPNPVFNSLKIDNLAYNTPVSVSDITGKIMLQSIMSGNAEINFEEFEKGVYFIKINEKVTRVIKQ